jgi:hypothetical protein
VTSVIAVSTPAAAEGTSRADKGTMALSAPHLDLEAVDPPLWQACRADGCDRRCARERPDRVRLKPTASPKVSNARALA